MPKYTHNLKVVLLDCDNKIVNPKHMLLEDIKNSLCKPTNHLIQGDILCKISWDRVGLNEVENYLMGDLFYISEYEDNVVYQHTLKSITNIEKKYVNFKLFFHLSKLL